MIQSRARKEKELPVFLFFCLGVLVLRLFYITKVNGPFVYADEFGYWAHAAHMTGHTWAGVMDGMGWYNFGYSFLLAPLFLLSDYMPVMYKTAVLINIIMGIGIYGLAYLISRRVFPDVTAFQRGMFALAASSFSSYIVYSYIAWCETLLTFLIWLVFYLVMSIEEKSTWWKCALLGAALGFACMVHNRALAFVIAAILCMILFAVQKKTGFRELMAGAAALAVMMIANGILRTCFVDLIEHNDVINAVGVSVKLGSANTMGGQTQKIMGLFSYDGCKRFLLNAAGQIWECLSATYLLFGCGMVYAVSKMWHNIKNKKKIGPYLFPVLAMLLSVAITGVFCYQYVMEPVSGKIRIDPLFYGRYNACFLGILVLLGIGFLVREQGGRWKTYVPVAAVYVGLSVMMYLRLGNTDDKYLNVVSAVGIQMFHWLGNFDVWKCAVIALLGAALIMGLCQVKIRHSMQWHLACMLLIFLFATTALYCMRISIRGENDYTMRYAPLYDYLNENMEKGEAAYIAVNGKPAYDLQSRLVDKPVAVLWPEDLDTAAKGAYVVIREEDLKKVSVTNYETCMQCEEFVLIRLKGR